MRKVGLVLGVVVVGFACSEQAGQMLVDAGEMMQPDAGAQTLVQCDQTYTETRGDGSRVEHRYSIVTVGNPRNVKLETCWTESPTNSFPPNVRCQVAQFTWFDGNDAYIQCGNKSFDADGQVTGEQPDPASLTVYE